MAMGIDLRGFVRDIKTWRAKKQEALLAAAGVKTIYREDWKAIIKSLRSGSHLVVGGGLRVLGDTRQEIRRAVDEVRAKGAVVMDAETGRIAGGDEGVALFDEALARIRGEKVMPNAKRAQDMQAASVKARTKGRMGEREAMAIWRDHKLTVIEAIDRMRGWSQGAAYRVLGKREVPAGRRAREWKL